MGKRFYIVVRILFFALATVNLVFAVKLLDQRTGMDRDEIRKYLATWQDYYVLVGILVIPYFDLALLWWGQHMRDSIEKVCKFIPQILLAGIVLGSFCSSLKERESNLYPGHYQ